MEGAPVGDLRLDGHVDELAQEVAVLGLRAEEPRRERLRPDGDVEPQGLVGGELLLQLRDDPGVMPARMAARDGAGPRHD